MNVVYEYPLACVYITYEIGTHAHKHTGIAFIGISFCSEMEKTPNNVYIVDARIQCIVTWQREEQRYMRMDSYYKFFFLSKEKNNR